MLHFRKSFWGLTTTNFKFHEINCSDSKDNKISFIRVTGQLNNPNIREYIVVLLFNISPLLIPSEVSQKHTFSKGFLRIGIN